MKLKSLIFTAFLTFPMLANALTPEQEQQIDQKIQQYVTAIKQGDGLGILDTTSPKVIAELAKQKNLSIKQLRQQTVTNFNPIMTEVKLKEFSYDLTQAKAGHTPQRDYLVIPYHIEMTLGKLPISANNKMLAYSDNQQWFLSGMDRGIETRILLKVYPDLANLKFPK